MVERFVSPHIFTPITLSMKSELKRVNLCVLKMFSYNFDDFLSSVSSPPYTSEIHKWYLFFGWKKKFFQVLFSCAQKNENLPQKKSLVCLRMSSSNFFNPSLRWHIIFKTCIRRGKKWHNYKHKMHTCLSQIPLTSTKRTYTYVW
jgi:hypothetical protein